MTNVHQAKGAEWSVVVLWDDFADIQISTNARDCPVVRRKLGSAADADHCLYVAATRAKALAGHS